MIEIHGAAQAAAPVLHWADLRPRGAREIDLLLFLFCFLSFSLIFSLSQIKHSTMLECIDELMEVSDHNLVYLCKILETAGSKIYERSGENKVAMQEQGENNMVECV